jgi:integrase
MYAGLRRGELMALRAESIDLDANVIHVERGWDAKEGEIETKGRNRRRVPIPAVLREHLVAHLLRTGRRDGQLAFGQTSTSPFDSRRLYKSAYTAWDAAGLKRIKPHECRRTFASLMIAAGVNPKALSDYMGHADIATTFNKYGHLMPGNEEQAAGLLDAYLERAKRAAG